MPLFACSICFSVHFECLIAASFCFCLCQHFLCYLCRTLLQVFPQTALWHNNRNGCYSASLKLLPKANSKPSFRPAVVLAKPFLHVFKLNWYLFYMVWEIFIWYFHAVHHILIPLDDICFGELIHFSLLSSRSSNLPDVTKRTQKCITSLKEKQTIDFWFDLCLRLE